MALFGKRFQYILVYVYYIQYGSSLIPGRELPGIPAVCPMDRALSGDTVDNVPSFHAIYYP